MIGRILATGVLLPVALAGQGRASLDAARFARPAPNMLRIDSGAGAGITPTPEQLRALIGLAIVRGVAPSDIVISGDWGDPANPLAPALPEILTWAARVADLAHGRSEAKMAVVLPRSDSLSRLIVERLEQLQTIFDIVTPDALTAAEVGAGQLRVGAQSYHAVLVGPADSLSRPLGERLVTLARNSGTVIAWRLGAGAFTWPDTILRLQVLDSLPQLRLALLKTPWSGVREPGPPALRVRALERGEDRVFLLFNASERKIGIAPTFRLIGQPELWNPDDGSVGLAPTRWSPRFAVTDVPIELDPYQLVAIVFRARPHSPRGPVGPPPLERTMGRAAQDWRFHFATGDTTPKTVSLGSSWTTIDETYSGMGVYEGTIELPALDRSSRYWLDLGQVHEVAEVELNGTPLGRRLWRPYRYEVTALVRQGINAITVRVSNTSANRRGTPQASGLLGPVRMILIR